MDEIDINIISLDYQVLSHYQDSLDINIISLDYQAPSHYQDSLDNNIISLDYQAVRSYRIRDEVKREALKRITGSPVKA